MDLPLLYAAAQTAADAVVNPHAGELAGEALGEISVLAGMLGRMFLPLLPVVGDDDKKQRLAVMTISAVALALYCRQAQVAVIGHGFTIISAFCVVGLATLGMFNLSDPENYRKANLSALANSMTLGAVGTAAPPPIPPPNPPASKP